MQYQISYHFCIIQHSAGVTRYSFHSTVYFPFGQSSDIIEKYYRSHLTSSHTNRAQTLHQASLFNNTKLRKKGSMANTKLERAWQRSLLQKHIYANQAIKNPFENASTLTPSGLNGKWRGSDCFRQKSQQKISTHCIEHHSSGMQ